MKGRYFYFEANGSSANQGTHLTEVQIFDYDGNNLALGRGVLRYSGYDTGAQPPSAVTDGNTDCSKHFDMGVGQHYAIIDLGAVYHVSHIKVWRYYDGSRYYKDVYIKVSEDDTNYQIVFSSATHGTYVETASGYQIDLPDSSYEPPKRFLYNGISLPALPEETLNNYKYAWIGKNTASGYYDLILSKLQPYYHSDGNIAFGTGTTGDVSWYRIDVATADTTFGWSHNKDTNTWFGLSARTLIWANCDLLNGSITNNNVYFRGSAPLPEEYGLKLISTIEAEEGTVSGGAVVSDRASTSGNVVVDMITSSSGSLTLNFAAPRDGYYIIKAYFTNDTRYFTYTLNGKTYTDKAVGSGFSSIASVEFQMYLLQGNNTIVITGNSNSTYAPMFDKFEIYDLATITIKYLIRCASKLYTVVDDTLSELENNELSAELFNEYGIEYPPSGALFIGLVDPELLYWQEDNGLPPILHMTITGVPPVPQIIITESYDMSHETILGIESVSVTASEDALFAISFDEGVTWHAHDGTQWNTLEDEAGGMTAATLNAITSDTWAEITTGATYMFKFVLLGVDSYVTSILVDYLN